MNLGLHDCELVAGAKNLLGDGLRLFGRGGGFASGNRDAVLFEELLRLIFVNVHWSV